MARIKMRVGTPICRDGIHPEYFEKDKEYEVDDRTRKIFVIEMKVANDIGDAVSIMTSSEKKEEPAVKKIANKEQLMTRAEKKAARKKAEAKKKAEEDKKEGK